MFGFRFDKLVMAMLVAGSVSLAAAMQALPCIIVNEEALAICGDCPGASYCICWYIEQSCPSERVICNGRHPVSEGGLLTAVEHLETCYWTKPCKSENGGLCHPTLNPCVLYGEEQEHGTLIVYEQDYAYCGLM